MSIQFKFDNIYDTIDFDISEYLTKYSKLYTDVTDIYFCIKTNLTDTDENALYSVTMGTDASIASSGIISIKINSFTNLVIGSEYPIALGIKFSGDTKYREMLLNKNVSTISILQDGIRG